jgi:hypothetical protein
MTEVTAETTASIEDMFLVLYCLIDDLYKAHVPQAVQTRSQYRRMECSDSEVLTLSVMQEALSMDSEASFLRFVRKNYLALFPRLLSRERYNRRRRALTEVMVWLFHHLRPFFKQRAHYLIVDSAPIETAAFVRSQSAAISIPEAAYGYMPSKKRHFFGFRLHSLVSSEGAILDFILAPAHIDERTAAQVMLSPYGGYYILGDNGYSGQPMLISAARHDYVLWTSPRPSRKPASEEEARWRRWLRSKRDLVETVFSMLADQFKLETTRAISTLGVKARVAAKLLAFNLSLVINHQMGRNLLAVKSLYL